jgi:hypothetical protein
MMNPDLQSRGNNLALLATLYPEAFAMAAASNSHFSLAARRLLRPRLPARQADPTQLPENYFLQFATGQYAHTDQLAA